MESARANEVATFDPRGPEPVALGDPPLPAVTTGALGVALAGDDLQGSAGEEVRRAWEALPTSLFGGEDGRLSARAAFVEVGLFGRLAGARRAGQSVDALVAMALSTPEVRRVKGHRAIIEAWIAPLRRFAARAVLAGGSPGAAPGSAPAARPPEELEEDAESEPERAATVVRYERVRAQQDAIVAAMRHGSLGRARQMIRGALRLPAARQAHLPGQVPVPPRGRGAAARAPRSAGRADRAGHPRLPARLPGRGASGARRYGA